MYSILHYVRTGSISSEIMFSITLPPNDDIGHFEI